MGILNRYVLGDIIKEARNASMGSETRNFYKNYFLDGIRAEAFRMDRATGKILVADTIYALVPTLLSPFGRNMGDYVANNTSVVFGSAKSLYDNVNRFLQAAYIAEEDLERRHKKITNSASEFTSAVGDEYNLRKIVPLRESGKLDFCLNDLEYLNDMITQVVSPIRNATEHGHGHAVLGRTLNNSLSACDDGFRVRQEVSKKVAGCNISGLALKLSGDVMYSAHQILNGYVDSIKNS